MSTEPEESRLSRTSSRPPRNERPIIVVVDDDESDMRTVRRVLRREGLSHAFRGFQDGSSALEALRQGVDERGPTLILLDIKMPLMSGFEFLDRLRSDETLKSHIVFVLSTSEDLGDVHQAYRRNVAGYLSKERIGREPDLLGRLLSRYLDSVFLPPEAGADFHRASPVLEDAGRA